MKPITDKEVLHTHWEWKESYETAMYLNSKLNEKNKRLLDSNKELLEALVKCEATMRWHNVHENYMGRNTANWERTHTFKNR